MQPLFGHCNFRPPKGFDPPLCTTDILITDIPLALDHDNIFGSKLVLEWYFSYFSLLFDPLSQVGEEIAELGEERSGMMNLLVKHLCDLVQDNTEYLIYTLNLMPIWQAAIMFGPIHSRGKR